MKAKDYAKMYFDAEDKNKISVEIARKFLLEIESISKARNVRFDRGLVPICNELNNKWQKFAQTVNEKFPVTKPILYNGFKNLVKKASPELYILWINNKR